MEYVFATGLGRSGTKFLTSLLSTVHNVHSVHEYIGNREFWLLSWYLPGTVYTMPFLAREKEKIDKIYNTGLFIDINGYLQNCVPELHATFKPIKIFHFVRDPKEVVRSLYTRRDDSDIHLIPKNLSEVEQWLDGDKFTQICWNWANTTEKLLSEKTELIHFEKIKSDFDYCNEKIIQPLNLNLSKTVWEKAVLTKVNSTKPLWYRWIYSNLKKKKLMKDELPSYPKWTDIQKKQFADICGSTMLKCGYEL